MDNGTKKTVFTLGHSTRPIEEFILLLTENNIQKVVDVRTIPRSRHNPQFNADSLPESLKKAGIAYQHMAGLGGLRHTLKDSINMGWHNTSFRGFADYMQTPEFADSLQELITLSQKEIIVLMCAETLPWRCHRSLIADALTIRDIPVEHIYNHTTRKPHELTSFARVNGNTITYPAYEE
ncbi:MAG: DUF488 domain-containing protein [Dehalococcoidales bacterium]